MGFVIFYCNFVDGQCPGNKLYLHQTCNGEQELVGGLLSPIGPVGHEGGYSGDLRTSVSVSVCPCVRASERLPLYLWNAWAETHHIWHMNTLGGGNGHYGDLDLICILSRSRGQRVQKTHFWPWTPYY